MKEQRRDTVTASCHSESLIGLGALLHHIVSFETSSAFLILMFFIAARLGEISFLDCTYLTWGQNKSCTSQCTHYPAAEKLHVNEKFSHLNTLRLEKPMKPLKQDSIFLQYKG